MGRKESNQELDYLIQTDAEESDAILDLARNELNKNSNQTKKKQKKIVGISVPILVTMLLFLLILPISFENGFIKPDYGASAPITYNYRDLTKIKMESVESFNQNQGTNFLSIHEAEVLETYQLVYMEERELIEEHYDYNGIHCVLLVSTKLLEFSDCAFVPIYFSSYGYFNESIRIEWTLKEDIFFGRLFIENCYYYFYIETENNDIINRILSNFS
ncbi:MAG TPA: hypothetical protein PKV66_03660 [Candidatus Pelethenecus sp.]|nr:hypothetical protein [Candidatus Pelethenecus sp.]